MGADMKTLFAKEVANFVVEPTMQKRARYE